MHGCNPFNLKVFRYSFSSPVHLMLKTIFFLLRLLSWSQTTKITGLDFSFGCGMG